MRLGKELATGVIDEPARIERTGQDQAEGRVDELRLVEASLPEPDTLVGSQ